MKVELGEQQMVIKSLSSELISLINYVELNKSGWWKKATSQIILGYLWEANTTLNEQDLQSLINQDLNVSIPIENINSQVEYLLSSKKIIKTNKKYSLTEVSRRELSEKSKSSYSEDQFVEKLFKELITKSIPSADANEYWRDFKNELISSVKKIGANTYTLLKSGRFSKTHDWLSGFLNKHKDSERDILIKVIAEFFNPNIEVTRNYILRLLNAYFFVEATQLNKDTINRLETTRKNKDIKIVLDTNFVFSILGLHENPADESATSLLSLANKIGNVKIRYYVLPTTLEEIKKVVSYQLDSLKRYRYSPQLARAAVKSGVRSSIAAKYFSESAKSETGLSPDAYFLPYTDGLLKTLEAKGIKTLEWPTIHYPTDQRVIEDQLTLWDKEKRKPENQQKRYEAIEHDLIFWYIIKDHRDGYADSALDESYWGVTIDWSMIQFDQMKRRIRSTKLPIVLHPTNLVQLLQFWVPRDETLESGILETMKLPLFFGDFDANDEKATIELIQALSTFKGIDDVDIDVLSSILADKALKQKIIEADSQNENVIEIVESEFARLASEYKSMFIETEEKTAKEKAELTKEKEQLAKEKGEMETTLKMLSAKVAELESRPLVAHERDSTDTASINTIRNPGKSRSSDTRLKILEEQLEAAQQENKRIKEQISTFYRKVSFVIFFMLCPVLVFFISLQHVDLKIAAHFKLNIWHHVIIALLYAYVIYLITLALAKVYIDKHKSLKEWRLVLFCQNIYRSVALPLILGAVEFKDQIIGLFN
ncbi:hypothetical protein [Cronobacter sakazakii]|uniref:hypothetical protein n=1 Tax=Cronobacter sakazakii TaxID=28141 RepID=UPI001F606742|nr:hypothetical protein [Cronobacter sakazakii]MDI9345653.1 hypothetical protein [Cronobacter sakazakii]